VCSELRDDKLKIGLVAIEKNLGGDALLVGCPPIRLYVKTDAPRAASLGSHAMADEVPGCLFLPEPHMCTLRATIVHSR